MRPADWMVLAVDAVGLGTPQGLLGSTVAGAMRLAGTRLAVDLGVMWTAVGGRALPLVNFTWKS